MSTSEEPWKLYYWPGLPGRGEFVRLVFEEAQVPYVDVGNSASNGRQLVADLVKGNKETFPVGAPPIVTRGSVVLAQTPNITFYLARKYGLCPTDETEAFQANQLGLTISDVVLEAHDTHHPISNAFYYEDQKDESLKKSKQFLKDRLPKWLGYFERVLQNNQRSKSEYLIGDKLSYVDLSLFHLVEGLEFAFPKSMEKKKKEFPLVFALRDRVKQRPNIAAYLKSGRRKPFSSGIFRYYPELDAAND